MSKNKHTGEICSLLFLPHYYILHVAENQHKFIK